MSKSKFAIVDFVEPVTVNPYTEYVQALADAGAGKALAIDVERGLTKDGAPAMGTKERIKFQKAANELDYTAKVQAEEVLSDTEIRFTFTLTERHKRGSAKGEESATVEESPTGEEATE